MAFDRQEGNAGLPYDAGGEDLTAGIAIPFLFFHGCGRIRLMEHDGWRKYMNNKEMIKYFYETVVTENLLDEVCRFVSPDCVLKIGEDDIPLGDDGMKTHLIEVKKTYPDYSMKILRQFCEGDYVISEFIMEGTHMGEWLGMKPTNKRLRFTGVDIDKVVNGKMVEHGGAVNTFETLFEEHMIKLV